MIKLMNTLKNPHLMLILMISIILGACNHVPYRIDIDQGNVLTQKDLDAISIGMSKNEVKLAIGGPLLNDTFHENRWDYVQYLKDGKNQKVQKGLVTLFFTNGFLKKIDADKLTEIKERPLEYGTTKN